MALPTEQARPTIKVAWTPIPGRWKDCPVGRVYLPSSQELALDSRANHTLYTGSRGPGKTDAQLMRFARHVGKGYGSAWRGIIFDRKYKNLDDLIIKSKKWFPRIFNNNGREHVRFLESKGDYKWVWDTGEELLFRTIIKPSDYDNYHGHEYPFIGWNELTKFPNPKLYDLMMSCNRSSWTQEKDSPVDKAGNYTIPPIPRDVFSTCNSKGVGHRWVKERFITIAPYGSVVRRTINVFNPQTQAREDYVRTQITIFGSYRENPHLDPGYIAELEAETDLNTRKSWLEGSWDIVAGGALDDLWNPRYHKIPRFPIPSNWYVDRSFDWGSTHPFSVGWWAEANGEEVTLLDGRRFAPARGTLIRFAEWYGVKKGSINEGCKMSAVAIARGIKEIEIALMNERSPNGQPWVCRQPAPGPADNQIGDVRESDVETIKDKMADEGVVWTRSNKSAGSRKIGLQLIRDRLEASINGEGPGLLIMDCCPAWLNTVPVIERDETDEDDVDTESEDHPYDDTRYRCLASSGRAAEHISVVFAN
jgi:hypothetical protein